MSDFEEMLAAYDRIIEDKALQQELLDAGLLIRVDPKTGEPIKPVEVLSLDDISHTHGDGRRFVDFDDANRLLAQPAPDVAGLRDKAAQAVKDIAAALDNLDMPEPDRAVTRGLLNGIVARFTLFPDKAARSTEDPT